MAHTTVPDVSVDDFGMASWADAVRAADLDLTARVADLETFAATDIPLATGVSGDLPFANLTQGSALSVLGVTGNATADHASIVAASDGQVVRRSGTAVGFGAVDLASANAITGALPLANLPTNFAQIFSFSVPLTNANLKALPTTGFTLKAAAGAGTLIVPLSAYLFVNTAAGAYTNIDTGATPEDAELYLDIGGNKFSSLVFNDTGTSNTMLSDLLGVASRMFQALYPFFANEDPLYGIYTYPLGVASFLNQPLQLKATNAGLGDYTGGHADNTGLAVGTCLLLSPP